MDDLQIFKLAIGSAILGLSGLWVWYVVFTIRNIKKYRIQRLCKLHSWEQKNVEFDGYSGMYTVCKTCGNLAGTDMYEEKL